MATDRITRCLGLVTQYNPLATSPGALIKADNVVIDRENIIEDRRGYAKYFTLSAVCKQLMVYSNTILANAGTTVSYDNSGTPANYSGSYSAPSGQKMRSVEAFSNLYVTTNQGVKVFSDLAGTQARSAGAPQSLDPNYQLNSQMSGFLKGGYQCAYRALILRVDGNNNKFFGYPSQRLWVYNNPYVNLATAVQGANTITVLNTNGIQVGQTVTGPGITGGTTVTGISGTTVTLGSYINYPSVSVSGNVTSGSNLIKSVPNTTSIAQGMSISGAGISTGATISVVTQNSDGTLTLTISSNATASTTGAVLTLTQSSSTANSYGFSSDKNIDLTLYLPSEVTTSDVIQFYRTQQQDGSIRDSYNTPEPGTNSDAAGDEMQLCYEYSPTSIDISNGYITFTDVTPDSLLGASLYTSPSQEGIQNANDRPPICKDMALFLSTFMCYANTATKQRQFMSMVGVQSLANNFITGNVSSGSNQILNVSATIPLAVGMTVTDPANLGGATLIPAGTTITAISGTTVTMSHNATGTQVADLLTFITNEKLIVAGTQYSFGLTENISTGTVAVSITGVASVDIDTTARSLIRVINRYASNTVVYAYYDSGPNDAPGQMHFDERGIGGSSFTIQVSASSIQSQFYGSGTQLPVSPATTIQCTSSNSVQKHAIYIAKDGQLEAVPTAQFQLAGSAAKNILRIAPLRQSLIIVKEDGIYRMTGNAVNNFTIEPLDLTVICKSADSIAVLANQVFMLSNQGVVAISENSVQVVGREIYTSLRPLIGYSNVGLAVGAAYQSDNAYLLSVPTLSTDTIQNQTYRFNIFTRTWTHWTFGFSAAVVEPGTDRLFMSYAGSSDVNRERKDFQDTDYADPETVVTFSAIDLVKNTVTFTSPNTVPLVGWSIKQGSTSIGISAVSNNGIIYTCTLNQAIPQSWALSTGYIFPSVGFDIEWDAWSGGDQGIGLLKQVSEVIALSDNNPGANTATSLIITSRSNFDDTRDENNIPIDLGNGAGLGNSWGITSWGGMGDNYGYRTYLSRNKQYCHLLNIGIKHMGANEKLSISGLVFNFNAVSDVVGR